MASGRSSQKQIRMKCNLSALCSICQGKHSIKAVSFTPSTWNNFTDVAHICTYMWVAWYIFHVHWKVIISLCNKILVLIYTHVHIQIGINIYILIHNQVCLILVFHECSSFMVEVDIYQCIYACLVSSQSMLIYFQLNTIQWHWHQNTMFFSKMNLRKSAI